MRRETTTLRGAGANLRLPIHRSGVGPFPLDHAGGPCNQQLSRLVSMIGVYRREILPMLENPKFVPATKKSPEAY